MLSAAMSDRLNGRGMQSCFAHGGFVTLSGDRHGQAAFFTL